MAYQVGMACYSTSEKAAQAVASDNLGAVIQHAGSAHVVELVTLSGEAITYGLRPVGGGPALQITGSYTAQPCNLLQVDDGLAIGWMVAAVWLAVYGVTFIARTVFHVGEKSDYGNT